MNVDKVGHALSSSVKIQTYATTLAPTNRNKNYYNKPIPRDSKYLRYLGTYLTRINAKFHRFRAGTLEQCIYYFLLSFLQSRYSSSFIFLSLSSASFFSATSKNGKQMDLPQRKSLVHGYIGTVTPISTSWFARGA